MGIRSKLELELSGFNNGWTDKSADLMDEETGSGGLPGTSPKDRVADTGELHFKLNNHSSNSAGLEGAYSPDHANCIAGFAEGIRVRYSQVVGAETFILHVGTLDEIIPDPDPLGGTFEVTCVSLDYMDDFARASVSSLALLENVRDDEIFSALVATMPRQPEAIEVSDGPDTFPIALDKVERGSRVLSVMQDVCVSSLSSCFVQGETVVYEPRTIRASSTDAVDTFDQYLVGLDVSRNRANRLNRVEVTAHPRGIDATPTTVLWSLPSSADNAIEIPSNTSLVLWTPYTDPNNQGQAVGGLDVDLWTPAAGTDYGFFANADGTGTDLTANISILVEPFGNTAKVTYTNSGPSGYLTVARVLGRAVRDYSPSLLQAEDTDSQLQSGLNILSFDAPYQSSIATAYEIAVYLVNIYKNAATQVSKVRFRVPNSDLVLASRLLHRGISDRVGIGESLTGLRTTRHYFINAVSFRSDNRNNLEIEWLLTPADQTQYWLLEVTGRGELDETTILGFGLVLGHTDVAHSDAHGDVSHGDTAHTDTHTDDAHQDTAHGDGSTHGDTAHSDTTHGDTAHSDTAFVDAHGDVAHSDTAHVDSHSDVAHGDTAHADGHTDREAFSDGGGTIPHGDVHFDSHTDAAHGDSHNDTAHDDVSHSDSHSDTAHADVTHSDTAHVDTAHSDSSGHADSAHSDAAHGDVAHADVTHSDVAHTDSHNDTAHGDIN